jgi:hypothetical protein
LHIASPPPLRCEIPHRQTPAPPSEAVRLRTLRPLEQGRGYLPLALTILIIPKFFRAGQHRLLCFHLLSLPGTVDPRPCREPPHGLATKNGPGRARQGARGGIIGGDPPKAGRRPFMLTAAKRTPCRRPAPGCYNSRGREALIYPARGRGCCYFLYRFYCKRALPPWRKP